ncbi:MAG TPA: phosphoribosylformylglycinamidine cyclo-ligase [Methanoculleus sp.]|nr:phosphoribosylformylglycinamidine cyclo-ligase [Methanoculleus sp.]
MSGSGGHTYRDAGVDIDLEADAVRALVSRLTFRREGDFAPVSGSGHFAGLIEFGDHVLALAVDGVGTKMLVADRMEDWSTIGIDCIAMNVNDLYVMNLEPVAFVDYVATDALDVEKMKQVGAGLNEGARLANMTVIGGETATLKGMVTGLDVAGTCLGIQKKAKVINGASITPGDTIIGIPSTGIHSNGYTLARKLVETYADYDREMPWGRTLGGELLTPTRIYTEVLKVTAACEVHGMCHITGGGLLNLRRLGAWGYEITHPLPVLPVFEWMASVGSVSTNEMYRTFNMGMGYCFIVPEESVATVLSVVHDARVAGHVSDEPGVRLRGEEIS